MIVFDTNVVSALRRPDRADPNVVAWASRLARSATYVSVVTIMELEIGALALERRDPTQALIIRDWLEGEVLPAFRNRILPIDAPIAKACARLHVPDRRPDRDAYIAATCLEHGFDLATRNTKDFQGTGVRLFNPWDAASTGFHEASAEPFA